jgi:quinol monooxygenase YgiN
MVVVVGRVRTDADKRDELIRIGAAVAGASREEAGCVSYRLYEDAEVANEFVFVEEWESMDALEAHFRTPHIAEFMGSIFTAIIGQPDVKFHDIARSLDLSDVSAPRG